MTEKNSKDGSIKNESKEKPLQTQEKTTLGGDFNSGVTSDDPAERDEIEKKGSMANIDQTKVRSKEEPNEQ